MTAWTVPATVLRWLDADTCHAALDLGFAITYTTKVRIGGVDAPERSTAAGKAALAWATTTCPPGTQVTVRSTCWDKYGRVLGDLFLPDGHDYGTALCDAGHAVAYDGGKR